MGKRNMRHHVAGANAVGWPMAHGFGYELIAKTGVLGQGTGCQQLDLSHHH